MDVNSQEFSVFQYMDYRELLRDFYAKEKLANRSYSYRMFATKAKLASPNYLKLVIDGSRRITDKNLPHFIRGLRLNKEKADYFKILVRFQNTKDKETKTNYLRKLYALQKKYQYQLNTLEQDRFEILRCWYYWAIREMILLEDFKADPHWIANKLNNLISPTQAKNALEVLKQFKFIQEQNGNYIQIEPLLDTGDDLAIKRLKELHKQFSELSIRSIFSEPSERRSINGLSIALSQENVQNFKKDLISFRNEMNRKYSTTVGNEEVYHLVMNFFPLTSKKLNLDKEESNSSQDTTNNKMNRQVKTRSKN